MFLWLIYVPGKKQDRQRTYDATLSFRESIVAVEKQ
jgi:hypothetical protein